MVNGRSHCYTYMGRFSRGKDIISVKRAGIPWKGYGMGVMAAVILFCFWAFGIGSVYGFSIFPDEFAYWSHAAGLAGYDWSDITSLSPYYSYGYSLLLFPVFMLCKDPVKAYRIAVGMNFVFLFLAYVFLAGTMKKIVPDKEIPVSVFALAAILAPYNLFYTQTTLTEVLLVSLYIIAGSLLFRYMENNRLYILAAYVAVLIYMYIVHMRTVGVVLSGMLVLGIHIFGRKGKKWHFLAAAGMAVLLFALAGLGKERILMDVYGSAGRELAADNDYSGQLGKIRYIFTLDGFYDFLISLCGKILYLGLATFGLFYWGIYGLAGQAVKMLKGISGHGGVPQGIREHRAALQEFALYVLLTVAAQVVISAVYLLTLGEIEDYTYGRYNELVLPLVMAAGLAVLWKQRARTVWAVTGILAVMQMAVTGLVVRQAAHTGADIFHGYFVVGIGYLYKEGDFTAGGFYAGAYLFGEFLTALITAAVLFCRRDRKRRYVLAAMVVIEFALAMHAEDIYLEPFKNAAFRDSRMADKITELQGEGRRVIYMDSCFPAYIGMIQFMARDADIQVMERRETAEDYRGDILPGDILIFAFDDIFLQEWADSYTCGDTYGHFTLLYNR